MRMMCLPIPIHTYEYMQSGQGAPTFRSATLFVHALNPYNLILSP